MTGLLLHLQPPIDSFIPAFVVKNLMIVNAYVGMEIFEFYASLKSSFFPFYCLHSQLFICTNYTNSQSKHNGYY